MAINRTASNGKSGMGGGCLVLFGIPFAGVGIFMLSMLLNTLGDWYRMQAWA